MRVFVMVLAVIAGMIASFLLNYLVIDPLLIPDPCYYHSHDTTLIFDLFYNLDAAEGCHPFPTPFNFILTVFVGGITGFCILKSIRRNTGS